MTDPSQSRPESSHHVLRNKPDKPAYNRPAKFGLLLHSCPFPVDGLPLDSIPCEQASALFKMASEQKKRVSDLVL